MSESSTVFSHLIQIIRFWQYFEQDETVISRERTEVNINSLTPNQ